MKNWLSKNALLALFVTLLLVVFVYRDSFASRFFQDDKLNLELASSRSFSAVIPGANHFRPISVQGFYFFAEQIFGYNPIGYHLLELVIFIATVYLVFRSAVFITSDERQSLIVTFLYALNISLFANFYWIANSQFVIGSFFFFLCFTLFYVKKKLAWLVIPLFLIGLASNEGILSLILILPVVSLLWQKKLNKNIFFSLCIVGTIWVFLRIFLFKLPTTSNYALDFNPVTAISTFRWYVLRAANLPEGVKITADLLFSGAFVLFLLSLVRLKINWRLITTGALWFLITLGIFIFLPKHMSAHYVTVALFGSSLIISELLPKKNFLLLVALALYLFLTIRGLDFLSQTHWIILKNTGPIGKF